jgi:hypothetical protein
MKIANKYTIASFLILVALLLPLKAQIPNTMYFMPGVPQSNRINPSIQSGAGFYLGLPGLAPFQFQLSSSSLAFNDIIYYNSDIDSLITPLHPLADKEAFLNNLQDVNYFLSSLGTSIASVGFRVRKSFFSFDITSRVDGNIFYPKGIFELVFNGLEEDGNISFGGLGVDVNVFNELSMGWSRKDFLIPTLDIGVRGKMLFGLANLTTKNSVFDLSTSTDSWYLNTEMQINAAAISLVSFSDDLENGLPIDFDDSNINPFNPKGLASQVIDFNQFGMAVDVGASIRPIKQLLISASVMDIGGISWKNTAEGLVDFEYEFTGIELNPFSESENPVSLFEELADSIVNSFSFQTGTPYFSKLNTKLFVGASFYPIEKIGFGFLSRTDLLNQRASQQFTGSVNMTTGKFANLSLSYSYINQKFNNIGAGIAFNVGGNNLYIISDNIVSGVLNPLNTRSVNLWFGMNIAFGWKKSSGVSGKNKNVKEERQQKERAMDRPLVI